MKNIEEMERRLKESGKADKVRSIAESGDGQSLLQKLDTRRLEQAVQAEDGDALRAILMDVLRTGEGRRIAGQLDALMKE